MKYITHTLFLFLLLSTIKGQAKVQNKDNQPLSIVSIAVDDTPNTIYFAEKGTQCIVSYNTKTKQNVTRWSFDQTPTGITVYNGKMYITTSYDVGKVYKIDINSKVIEDSLITGMGTCSPYVDPIGEALIVCNQYKNDVVKISLNDFKEISHCHVQREPNNIVLGKNRKYLFVTNFLPYQPANLDTVAADVSVIDYKTMKVVKSIKLTNGSNALRDMVLTNDGKYAIVTHNLGRFQVPTSQLQQGWMNTSAMSLIDTEKLQLLGTVLLDEPDHGAAGTWGIVCNDEYIFVSHSGAHDMSVISYKEMIDKFNHTADKETLSYDLRFLNGLRKRVSLKGNGPRDLVIKDQKVYIPTYFSDILNVYSIDSEELSSVCLNPDYKPSVVHHGEQLFNDASYCLEGWQSCNGCHPGDARTDGMNWDLLNDGIGNPKNCKSMLYAHQSPPAMISGIRPDAETAVRAGFQHIQFAQVTDKEAKAVDAYLQSLKPLPSPYLTNGELSEKARKGEKLFVKYNCHYCHSGPLFTDGKMHRIGDVEFENGWDTPTLKEVWRTGPYLYDGRAKSIKEVFTIYHHGLKDKKLKKKDIECLVEYVKSL
ncbi:hypothetical protein K5X82_03875 [Halosquirtibacter xylanolyticus]|uniref:hypothetical protein n=1 Tax=Halosquirtibacter xylanolyticus TaxID=3374599 RepID=UPI00374A93A4|nr:hypothetical protein K5X82_03875 [Prolixibacteraceae bacterium]